MYIAKSELKILVSPTMLRVQVKIITEQVLKKSLTKSILKKIPGVSIFAGFGFAVWRAYNGQYYRAAG